MPADSLVIEANDFFVSQAVLTGETYPAEKTPGPVAENPSLAVGLTPQLLPAIININLAKGSQTMAVHGVIVRRLASIENFGGMDVLCSDKTGTLTVGVVKLDGAVDTGGHRYFAGLPAALLAAFWPARLYSYLSHLPVGHGSYFFNLFCFSRNRQKHLLSLRAMRDSHRWLAPQAADRFNISPLAALGREPVQD